MNLENIGKDCPCYEVDCSDIMFDIGEFCGLPPNNGKLTIQVNGSTVGDFSANQQEDETINITTPTSQDIADAVAGEALLREQADNTLQGNIDAEELARQRADRDIQAVLDGESLARVNEDRNLQSQIDAIASKSDVVDVVGTYAELQAYDTSKLNDNDVVKVLDDSTHNDAMTYYRWNKTTQTWSYIGQESPYYSKSQMDTLLGQKQDNLTAGTGIALNGSTISADMTVLVEKSELSNYAEKSDTYTKTEVDNLVEPKLSVEVVEQLPVQGEQNKLYLTEKAHTTQTATGNPITATITDGAGQIEDFQLDGDTYQQSYTGKNLFDKETISEDYWLLQDGSIQAHADYSTSDFIPVTAGEQYYLPATKTRRFKYYNSSKVALANDWDIASGQDPQVLTIPVGASYARITIDYRKVDINSFQFEKGSTATSYEPYTGGASPNPSYPQPIQVVTGEQTVSKVGKNLFDKDKALDNYFYTSTGSKSTYSKAQFCNQEFRATSNEITMSFSGAHDRQSGSNIEANVRIAQYDASGNFISRLMSRTNGYTFTLDANTKSFILSVDNGPDAWFDDLQIEYGSSASSYAPYSKTDYPISLGSIELCKLGTYQDYIYENDGKWYLHKETGKYTFTGSETVGKAGDAHNNSFYYASTQNVGTFGFSDIDTSNMGTGSASTVVLAVWSDRFLPSGTASIITSDRTGISFNKTTNGVDCRLGFGLSSPVNTAQLLTTWLTNNKPSVYYPLATATDTEITDTTLISQLNAIASASLENGSNTLTNSATGSNLAGDMEVDYFGYDPTNRYDKWLWLDINNAYEKLGS